MELFLDLKSIPTFLSCDYFAGADAAHVICGSPDEDRIVFAVRGSLKSDGFTLQAGRYYILRAGEGIRFTGVDPEYFVVSFFGTFEFTESVGQPLPVSGRFDYKSVTRYWNRLLEIRDQCIVGQSVSFIEQQGLFCMILGELYSYRYTPASEYLAKAIMDEVVEHYTSGFSLEKLSRTYFYSANYIIRVFKRKYHVTPYQHIIHLRVEKAKQLLSSGNQTCQEIAEVVGYRDISAFYKAFVSETGESPDRWRRLSTERIGDYRKAEHAIRNGE